MIISGNITDWVKKLSNNDNNKGTIFNIELWHSPVWLSLNGEAQYWMLKNWIRVIEEWLVESIIQWLHIWRLLRKEFNRKVHLVLSLSDLHWVLHNDRLLLKKLITDIEYPLIDIFLKYWVDDKIIENFESWLKLWSIVFQSNWTSKIRNKIRNIINLFKKIWPNNFYDEYWFILYEVQIWDYYWIVLFSSECFSDSILKQWVPLLFWEEKSNMSTQCWPTVTWIQQEILWNNKLNRIITIDNHMDVSIKTKSIRG